MSRIVQPAIKIGKEVGKEVGMRGAKQRVEDIKSGANRACVRQATATSHFAKTGEKLHPATVASAAAPGASASAPPSDAAQQAATQAIIRSRLQQAPPARR